MREQKNLGLVKIIEIPVKNMLLNFKINTSFFDEINNFY